MALDDVKKRFVDEIKLRAYDDKYVDKNEEREILQVAIAQGISIDSARSALAQVCEHNGYILESTILKEIKDQVETDSAGYVITEPGSTRTKLAGIFAVGDLVDHTYRQAVTAAGTGSMGALDAEWYLRDTPPSLEGLELASSVPAKTA